MLSDFPSLPGSYALFLTLSALAELSIGKLGVFAFPAGEYVYMGSARGSGGLGARLRHHLRPATRPHWHIDYLRTRAVVIGGVYVVQEEIVAGNMPLECAWSQALLALPGVSVPVEGFGASDCSSQCGAHLGHFPQPIDVIGQIKKISGEMVIPWIIS